MRPKVKQRRALQGEDEAGETARNPTSKPPRGAESDWGHHQFKKRGVQKKGRKCCTPDPRILSYRELGPLKEKALLRTDPWAMGGMRLITEPTFDNPLPLEGLLYQGITTERRHSEGKKGVRGTFNVKARSDVLGGDHVSHGEPNIKPSSKGSAIAHGGEQYHPRTCRGRSANSVARSLFLRKGERGYYPLRSGTPRGGGGLLFSILIWKARWKVTGTPSKAYPP